MPVLSNRYGASLLNAEVPCLAILAGFPVQVFRLQPRIKLVEHDVGQERRQHAALRNTLAGCPTAYGPATTIYNRWNRWSHRRFWQRLFEALRTVTPDDDFQALDSTTAKAHRSAAGGKGGAEEQGIGRSLGGRMTKTHAVCDAQGRPVAFAVTPGQLGDIRAAIVLIAQASAAKALAADCAYDARGFRLYARPRCPG